MTQKFKDPYNLLNKITPGGVLRNYPLSKLCTFKIGGPAKYLYYPNTISELQKVLRQLAKIQCPVFILGQGSNVLFPDQGLKAVVIKLDKCCKEVEISGSQVTAGAAVGLTVLINKTSRYNLGGIEFLAGIPGTVGGAIIMNAGLKKEWIGDHAHKVLAVNKSGKTKLFTKKELKFGYRNSSLKKGKWIVLQVMLKLKRSPKPQIMEKIKKNMSSRKSTQPLNMPSAGSIFKNPKGDFAGRLLEQAGCKGMRVGQAMVSEKHANFIVNLGGATGGDVLALMDKMKEISYSKFRVALQPEIEILMGS